MNTGKKVCMPRGFTSLELLMVIVVIGILSSLAFPRFLEARDRGYIGAAQQDLSAVRQALAVYAADYDRYPEALRSYEDFQQKMVDRDGQPFMTLPSGRTFLWISYDCNRSGSYVLRIQALDAEGTEIVATADKVTILP